MYLKQLDFSENTINIQNKRNLLNDKYSWLTHFLLCKLTGKETVITEQLIYNWCNINPDKLFVGQEIYLKLWQTLL